MQNKPNFILIFPDQWRGDCLGITGHPIVQTPYLDHIANEGISFTNAYSQAPTCIPARACLATGLSPSNHGRLGYEDRVEWNYAHTMMKYLRDGGYQTFQAGKTHFYPQRAHLGFEEMRLYEIPIHHVDFESDYHIWLERETGGKVKDTAREVDPNTWGVNIWMDEERLHPTHWTTDQAIELISRRDTTRPFFIQVGYHRPHAPYDPPQKYYDYFKDIELDDVPVGDWTNDYQNNTVNLNAWEGNLKKRQLDDMRRAYYAHMKHIDYEIGRLYNWLKKKRMLDNTYIIFTSDHGELLGDHHLLRKQKPYEGSSKIPFILRPPTKEYSNAKTIIDKPVSHIDILPTLLQLSGLQLKHPVDGSSLMRLLTHEETNEWREYIHGEHACGTHGWQYLTNGKEKYIWETFSGSEFYFDLINDPKELHNGIYDKAYQKNINQLRNRLISILEERKADQLIKNGSLSSGKVLPNIRDWLRNQ